MMPETELSLATVVPYVNSPIMTASSKIADTGVGSDSPDDFICAGTKFFGWPWLFVPALFLAAGSFCFATSQIPAIFTPNQRPRANLSTDPNAGRTQTPE